MGAIVYKGSRFLIVGKVKMMDAPGGPVDIPIQWHIPGGGIIEDDKSSVDALMRELKEETGSQKYRIVRQFEDRLCFDFPQDIVERTGLRKQETVMFLVEYTGTGDDLKPTDDEIEQVEFVSKEELLKRIFVKETREYFIEKIASLSW